jgi:hypothetical protein
MDTTNVPMPTSDEGHLAHYQTPQPNPLPVYATPNKCQHENINKIEPSDAAPGDNDSSDVNNEDITAEGEAERALVAAIVADDGGGALQDLLDDDRFGRDERLLLGPLHTKLAGDALDGIEIDRMPKSFCLLQITQGFFPNSYSYISRGWCARVPAGDQRY